MTIRYVVAISAESAERSVVVGSAAVKRTKEEAAKDLTDSINRRHAGGSRLAFNKFAVYEVNVKARRAK
jgi:hypothetical protein